jgi:tetratricopeptide (TPR) repeat protein
MMVFSSFIIMLAVGSEEALENRLSEVKMRYDIALAQEFVAEVRTEREETPTPDLDLLLARGLLALAELYRIDFEALDEVERSKRRAIGKQIDGAADEALANVDATDESSDQQRIRSDLLAVKIRSNYQAKKYRKRMEHAAARALELDSNNAAAYVSASISYLYADEKHRGDVNKAIELLETARDLDPTSEKAILLLAYAHEKNDDTDLAKALLEIALQNNPHCQPARDMIERIR